MRSARSSQVESLKRVDCKTRVERRSGTDGLAQLIDGIVRGRFPRRRLCDCQQSGSRCTPAFSGQPERVGGRVEFFRVTDRLDDSLGR